MKADSPAPHDRADELADTYLGSPYDETPPEVASLITGDVPSGGKPIEGSGAVDTADPLRIASRDNSRAFRR